MDINDIDVQKIVISKFEKKEVKGGKATYYDLYLGYEYAPGKTKPLYIEFPEMESFGVVAKEYSDPERGTYMKYTISFAVDSSNPAHAAALEKMDAINLRLRQLVDSRRKECPKMDVLVGFKPEVDDFGAKFKPIVARERDDDGNPIADGSTSYWFKLNNFTTKAGKLIKSRFIDLDGGDIEWELMKSVKVKASPCVNFSKLYLGQKIYPFIMMSSCVVSSWEERQGFGGGQKETIARLNSENTELKEKLRDALAKARETSFQFQELKPQPQPTPKSSPPKVASTPSSLGDFLGGGEKTPEPGITSLRTKIPKIPASLISRQVTRED